MTQRVDLSTGGVESITRAITGVGFTGATTATLQYSFGSYTAPTTWQTADSVTVTDDTHASVTFRLGAGHYNVPTGTYWLWTQMVGGDVRVQPYQFIVTNITVNPLTQLPVFSALTVGEVA